MTSRQVTIIGSGVAGLTCALRLCTAGWQVHVISRQAVQATTSAVAAAFWWPYDLEPTTRTRPWALETLDALRGLAKTDLASGVRLRRGRYFGEHGAPDPWFLPMLGCRPGPDSILESAIADMPIYLDWLHHQCLRREVTFAFGCIDSFEHVPSSDVIVDCSGLGAHELNGDTSVEPRRGQIVLVAGTDIDTFVKDSSLPGVSTYIYPRLETVVLGGTYENSGDDTPDDATTAAIVNRCAEIDPRVKAGHIVDVRVGLRPCRPSVRVELDRGHRVPVVHNYGHGQAGVSLSWGCAGEVVKLCEAAVS